MTRSSEESLWLQAKREQSKKHEITMLQVRSLQRVGKWEEARSLRHKASQAWDEEEEKILRMKESPTF